MISEYAVNEAVAVMQLLHFFAIIQLYTFSNCLITNLWCILREMCKETSVWLKY